MKLHALTVVVAAAFAPSVALAAASQSGAPQPKVLSRPDYTPTMEKLRQAAQHVRQSIQAIAAQPAWAPWR